VHLANYDFSDVEAFTGGIRLTDTLVGITADYAELVIYFPELYPARWFQTTRQEAVPIWAFHQTGVRNGHAPANPWSRASTPDRDRRRHRGHSSTGCRAQ
jgi:hypothetical protein